jgi:hypothetical protein
MSEFADLGDEKDWARKIMRRHQQGEKVNQYPLQMAREALHLPKPEIAPRQRAHHGPVCASAPMPASPPVLMTPAEAYYAAERAARGA